VILIPVKNLSSAKQRLAAVLDQPARTALAQAMLHDVFAALDDFDAPLDLALGLGQCLAVVEDDQLDQLVARLLELLLEAEEHAGPLHNGRFAPGAEGLAGAGDGVVDFVPRRERQIGQDFARRRIGHRQLLGRPRRPTFAGDEIGTTANHRPLLNCTPPRKAPDLATRFDTMLVCGSFLSIPQATVGPSGRMAVGVSRKSAREASLEQSRPK
jgi:hypothetical protein